MPRASIYGQIADQLRERIQAGTSAVGNALPPEGTLTAKYRIHRLPLRTALGVVAQQQIILRRQGADTFIRLKTEPRDTTTTLFIDNTQGRFFEPLYAALCAEAHRRSSVNITLMPRDDAHALEQLGRLGVGLRSRHHRRLAR